MQTALKQGCGQTATTQKKRDHVIMTSSLVGVPGQQSVKFYRFLSNSNVCKPLKINALYNYIILTIIELITPILNYHAKNTPKSLVRFYLFCTFANEFKKTNCYGTDRAKNIKQGTKGNWDVRSTHPLLPRYEV
jgi:hypothetical protein